MARYRFSVRLRMGFGLGLLLLIFGAALLVTLQQLAKLKSASDEVSLRLDARGRAQEAVRIAEQLQRDFVVAETADPQKLEDFREVYRELDRSIGSLLRRDVGQVERSYLVELRGATARLGRLLVENPPGSDRTDPVRAAELAAESRRTLDRIDDLNDRLITTFDVRAVQAAEQAQASWALSSGLAKVIFPMAFLVSVLVVYYTHRSVVGPVRALVDGTKALTAGELEGEIDVDGAGEFRELAESFNLMARTLQANQRKLAETEKMAGVGRLAAGVAHEINNPMAVIIGHARMLLAHAEEGSPEQEQLQAIVEEATQCKNIINSLLDLSRPSETTPGEVINPGDVVAEVLNMADSLQLTDGVDISVSVIDRPLPLTISGSRLRQLALNIVRNALEALKTTEKPRLTIEGYVRPRSKLDDAALSEASSAAESFLLLAFADNGPGIEPRDMERLFEPFFTTRAEGTGLGLAISYNIAHAHGGYIEVDSKAGRGSTFRVGLPVSDEAG